MNRFLFKSTLPAFFCFFPFLFIHSQSSPYNSGIIVKFKEGVSYQQQSKILGEFPELKISEEKENAIIKVATLAFFSDKNISDSHVAEIIFKIEKNEEVIFANPLLAIGDRHFAGALGEFYVKLFSKEDYKKLETVVEETNTKILREYEYMPNVFILSADKFSKGNSKEMAKYFTEKGLFKYASPNMLFTIEDCSVNDQYYNRQWAIENTGTPAQFNGTPGADMDVDSAWTITTGSPTIKIAVLDSGVDTTHEDLVGNLLPGFDATDTSANNSHGYPNTNFPSDGHGTCCAGIIAANANNNIGIAGVAYNCKIIPVKIFHYVTADIPWSTGQWGLDGINWSVQVAGADILSNSWGIPDSLMVTLGVDTIVANDAIHSAYTNGRNGKGVPMLFSAGNEPDTFCLWPANNPNTIAVAATTMCDELKTFSDCSPENWSSNHGTGLDIAAPGVKIPATDITGNKGFNTSSTNGNYYLSFNGTSAACPNAAGVMALILSANPELTAEQARAVIFYSCQKVGGYSYNVNAPYGSWSMELGYGRVNAYRALQTALGTEQILQKESLNFFVFRDVAGNNYLNISLITPKKIIIEIFDVLGKEIIPKGFQTLSGLNNANGNFSIPMNNGISASGVYFFRLKVDDDFYSGKFIVNH